jgi:nuclear pore complex protein Nup133
MKDDITVGSMDVDEDTLQPQERILRQDTVFAKSEEVLVTFHGHLPTEVKHVLRNAGEGSEHLPTLVETLHGTSTDFFRDAYVGDVDASTGFALVATPQACFVWQHTQELAGIPTCYIFPCPVDPSQAAPLYTFVPYGGSREPGLILASQAGEIWFWDNIGVGLAGGEQYSKILLELHSNEIVNSLTRLDVCFFSTSSLCLLKSLQPQTFIASTSTGRLFRLTLTTSGGRYHLTSRLFSRMQSSLSLSRFLPSLWSSPSSQAEAGNIAAIALGAKTNLGTDIWAIVESHVQKWNVAAEGFEEFTLQEDIGVVLRQAIQDPQQASSTYLDLELLDLAVDRLVSLFTLSAFPNTG